MSSVKGKYTLEKTKTGKLIGTCLSVYEQN